MKQRKVPLRKCTGCQEMKNKKELIRIVRNDAGEFALDRTGKLPGRGAYICPNAECLAKAQKSKGLERSFKVLCRRKCMSSCFKNWRNRPMNKFFPFWALQAGGKACCRRGGRRTGGAQKQAYLLILAQDASKNTKKKFTNSAVYYELPWQKSEPRRTGRAIGAEMRSIIAITEKGFAKN